ncbi:MAG: hypothetical protein A2Y72_00235 [Chloroflexi bacterium RBG_13_53_26]|nr:MAG: hypothetical protein A2Y72_00235 [Chloroflexi bacterium RBG_13_53_26]
MKTRMKRSGELFRVSLSGRETGEAFVTVLALLVLGAIVITPLLGFMITGLKAGQSHEDITTELYSADAGVQYAIWELQNGGLFGDDGPLFIGTVSLDPFEINGDNVTVTIENENDEGVFFKIVSEATDMVTGSMTRVRSRVTPTEGYQGNFFENGITGLGNVDMSGGCNGDIQCAGTLTVTPGEIIRGDVTCWKLYSKGLVYGDVRCAILDNQGTIYGDVEYYTLQNLGVVTGTVTATPLPPDLTDLNEIWPEQEYLTSFYQAQVPSSNYPSTIVNACSTIGPLYMGYTAAGAARSLTIDTKTQVCEVKLNGTIFVTGDFTVTSKTLVNLNGQTIYCLGDIYFAPGSYVKGSGVIIGLGTVRFQPNIVSGGVGDQSAIVRYNGSVWANQTSNTVADLNDVWGSSATTVYAVGDGGVILKTINSGTLWTAMTSATTNALNGVWGTADNNIFAVGDGGTVMRYDGAAWSAMTSGTTSNLNDVWGSALDNVVYAVGDGGTILRYKDGGWSGMTSLTDVQLNSVWRISGSDVYAVGAEGTIRRYDGNVEGTWTSMSSGTTLDLRHVWGSSASDIFFVGDEGTIRRYKDGNWYSMTIDTGIFPQLMGIWGSASNDVYVVGELGVIIHYGGAGTTWTQETSPTTKDLNAIWGSSSANIYAVGENAEDFIFLQSVNEWVELKPGGEFHGSMAGAGTVELLPGSNLMAPKDLGRVNFPRYRWIRIDTYIIEQH